MMGLNRTKGVQKPYVFPLPRVAMIVCEDELHGSREAAIDDCACHHDGDAK